MKNRIVGARQTKIPDWNGIKIVVSCYAASSFFNSFGGWVMSG
jgi:hypothetical protein